MALNFGTLVLLPCQDMFGRMMTFTPLASQPAQPAFSRRCIFGTRPVDIMSPEDGSVISDQQTIIDIRETEFAVLPAQFDRIDIPAEDTLPALGTWEVVQSDTDGGGETTLVVRKWEASPP